MDLSKISTHELLEELMRREEETNLFDKIRETPTSYTLRVWKTN